MHKLDVGFYGVLLATLGASVASAEVGVTDTTIKIGTFGAMTGPYCSYVRQGRLLIDGAQIVFNEVNAKGGIYGRKIQYVREDDRCDAATAIVAAQTNL